MEDQPSIESLPPAPVPIFTLRQVILYGFLYGVAIIASNLLVRGFCEFVIRFDCPTYWPMSVGYARIPALWDLLAALVALAVAIPGYRFIKLRGYRPFEVIGFALLLILLLTLAQGFDYGFFNPIAGGRGVYYHEYYHDAIAISSPLGFLSDYVSLQPNLLLHARTHPPGAVLATYGLLALVKTPEGVSLAIALISVLLSGFFLNGVLKALAIKGSLRGYLVLLFLLIPAVTIYYAATIDALVATLLLGCLYFLLEPRPLISITGMLVCLAGASFLSFGFLFILPVMAGHALSDRQKRRQVLVAVAGLVGIYVLVALASGFNYYQSFQLASAIENPEGFRGISDFVSYFFTRIESILEILMFFGPYLAVVGVWGLPTMRNSLKPVTLFALGIGTLLAMLLAGVYRTGETARVALFIYPYLLLPVAHYLKAEQKQGSDLLIALVFAQSLGMQTLGAYFW